ncbi:GDSL esterase/lipase At5g37690-like isoform X1 [Triticum dicoccoides]|uniref:GDSL esterase/lipase At5g37690-like isoform X1 n=1 Tax=Triticum dicoccoides TaxID=85692 RepID=UPI000E7975CF|nr:GDSL esterase/lipase At5g37690-like isoform X1 [Triticum dicoccoides]
MKGVVAGLVMVLSALAGFRPGKTARAVPAIYVLGDSSLDVGNNNYLPGNSVPRANKPFHGVDFPGPGGPRPTGRFSNGYNVADFIAKNLGFERSPPAYLSLKAHRRLIGTALLRGVSYASAGAGILDSTGAGNNIPLSKQVQYFHSTRAAMEAKLGSAVVSDLLAESFFLIGIGSNDLIQFAMAQQAKNKSTTQSDVAALYGSLISNYSATITDLYMMGARKIGIINVGLSGCIPMVRAHDATGACNDGTNELAAGFNGALESFLADLAPRLPGLAYSLADGFAHRQALIADPQAQGFVNATSACCGSGRLGGEAGCLPTSNICGDRDGYVYWDWVHATQRAAKIAADAFFHGPAQFTMPLTFKQLAEKKGADLME